MNKELSQLSGLEQLNLLVEGKIPPPSIAETTGQTSFEVKEGFCKVEFIPDNRHLNPMGGVHGGLIATILDSVTGTCVHSVLKAGESYGTVDLNVKMLRPLKVGKSYFAEGKVINISKSLGISEGKVYDEEGKIYGYGSATCMILRK